MTTTTPADTEEAPKLPNAELDSLVAPIALYSDPLLAQTLAASTYPLEIIQLQQWMVPLVGVLGVATGQVFGESAACMPAGLLSTPW
jgi:hypothetical protein